MARTGKLNQHSDFITLLGDRAYFIAPLIHSNKRRLPSAPPLKYNPLPPSCFCPRRVDLEKKKERGKGRVGRVGGINQNCGNWRVQIIHRRAGRCNVCHPIPIPPPAPFSTNQGPGTLLICVGLVRPLIAGDGGEGQ